MRCRLVGFALFIVGCAKAPASSSPAVAPAAVKESDAIVMIRVAAPQDSAVKLAQFALAIADGTSELPKARKEGIVVARRYAYERRGGQVDVAIIAIVQRPQHPAAETTFVQLSSWALETRAELPQYKPQPRPAPGRGPIVPAPAPAVPPQRPAVAMRPNAPRRITPADTTDWAMLQLVLVEFTRRGAQRMP